MKETFQIYLRSNDALIGSENPHKCTYDLSTIIPNINTDSCRLRVSYFDIAYQSSEFKTAGVSTIMIKLLSSFTKNCYETTENGILRNSSLIGVCSTGIDHHVINSTVSNLDFVEVGNIFNGVFTIILQDQDGDSLASILNSSSKSWILVLDIEVEGECQC